MLQRGDPTGKRLAELVISHRNTRRLISEGAQEAGASHYPAMVVLHGAWLLGLWILALNRPVSWPWLAAFFVGQATRVWVVATLGRRWTTRIIVLPGAPLVRKGPYRLLAHPNYVAVAIEVAALPLAFGLAWFAVVFSLLNAMMLFVRVRAEDSALAEGPTKA
jgi:methyltransferase